MQKVNDVMSRQLLTVSEDDSVAAAARLMARCNVGVLPVRGKEGRLTGVITDRDLVTRVMASGQDASHLPVGSIMTRRVVCVTPEDTVSAAADTMGREQVRRLPVTRDGRLVGMVSLADVCRREDYTMEAAEALAEISKNIKNR